MLAVTRWALVVLCLLGCGDDDALIAIPPRPDASAMDAGDDDARVRECDSATQCDDGIDCTNDLCLPSGECASFSDSSRCSDGVFCNGLEQCNPALGCEPGTPQTCNDMQLCTIDRCDEAAKACVHQPRDFDQDGEVDFHCTGGTDCNDLDATQGARASEVCTDGVDNDCDEVTDESDCGGPAHDDCDDALDLAANTSVLLQIRGARSDFGVSCGATGERDLVLRFVLDEASDVALDARGLWSDGSSESASVAVRAACGDPLSEVTCATGFPARARMRALPAGEYFVVVGSSVNAQQVLVKLDVSAATEAPSNTACESAIDISAGGRVELDFVDVPSFVDMGCGFAGSPDLSYAFELAETRDVVLSTYAPSGERINVSLRTDCADASTELRCVTGTPAFGRFRSLPPGRYALLVEGPFAYEVQAALDVRFEPPTAEPEGDSCASAIELPLSTTLSGTLSGKQDLVSTCGFFYRDAVYQLEIDAPTDLRVAVDGGDTWVTLAVQSECGERQSELSCVTNASATTRLRNVQPGTYAVVIEAPSDLSFSVMAEPLPLTVPVEVMGNDTCALAHEVPGEGGLFVGDTLLMLSDYRASCGGPAQSNDAVYKLVLNEPRRVRATLDGDHDTVLYRFHSASNPEPSVCVPFGESGCNDDADVSTRSVLDETLGAGTHYYVVSGFGVSNSGAYTFEVDVTAQ